VEFVGSKKKEEDAEEEKQNGDIVDASRRIREGEMRLE